MKFAGRLSALTAPPPLVVYSTDRSKAVVPVLVLLFVALWFILRGDLFYVLPCVILFLCVFSPFSIAITSLGEKRASLGAFRTFVRFALVWFCLFPLPLSAWEGLRFVIVAPPGLFFFLLLLALTLSLQSNLHLRFIVILRSLRFFLCFVPYADQIITSNSQN